MRLPPLLVFFTLITTLNACDEDKPYTPFAVASSVEKTHAPTLAKPQLSLKKPRPQAVIADAVPATRKWNIFEHQLVAPEGLGFISAIKLFREKAQTDDPQGKKEASSIGLSQKQTEWEPVVYAWLAPANLSAFHEEGEKELAAKSDSNETLIPTDRTFRPKSSSFDITGLYRFDAAGRAVEKIAQLPDRQPLGGSCKLHTKILLIGEQTIFLQHDSSCKKQLLLGQAPRSLQIIQPQRGTQSTLLNWYLLAPLPGEKIQLGAQAIDRDKDGHEDFSITVSLTSPQGITESADFSWIVRAAGASQESDLPYQRLKKRVERLKIASMRIKERVRSSLELDALRRLLFAACKGSETEKVLDDSGTPLDCGNIGALQAQMTIAQIRAAAAQGQFARAIGHYEHALWSTAHWSAKDKAAAEEIIDQRVTHEPLHGTETLPSLSLTLPGTPHVSPFRFDQGQLLVLEGERYRVAFPVPSSPLLAEEDEPSIGHSGNYPSLPSPHSLILKTKDGAFIKSALASCNRAEVQIALIEDITKPPELKPLNLLAPRPAGCRSFGLPPLPLSLVGFSGQHLNAIVAAELVSTGGRSVPLNVSAAYGTTLGLVVQGNGQFKLYKSSEVAAATHCEVGKIAIDERQTAVAACLQEGLGKVYFLEARKAKAKSNLDTDREPPSGKSKSEGG